VSAVLICVTTLLSEQSWPFVPVQAGRWMQAVARPSAAVSPAASAAASAAGSLPAP